WVGAQPLTAPVSDYLYHGARKIWTIAELDLLPKELVASFVRQLAPALLPYCPDEDRELLRENLERLGQAISAPVSGPSVLHRQPGETASAAHSLRASSARVWSRELRRLSLLLEHLRPLATSAAAPPEKRSAMASQFMTVAAVQAQNPAELDTNLGPLRAIGIDTATEHVFRTLAQNIAGWLLPRVEGREVPVVSAQQLTAMRQIVALAEDPAEAAKRFRELVHAAVEQFNEGQLGRASTMLELAEKLASEQKVQPPHVEAVRQGGHGFLDQHRLRRYSERHDYRLQLRTVLSFYRALQPAGLLAPLADEPRREQLHLLLALLEVHEQAARLAAWETLQASVQEGTETDAYFQRNLDYLLRIIPRPESASIEDEINVVTKNSGRTTPPPLVKQVIAFLSSPRHEKAERALVTYLKVFENMLLQPDTAAYGPQELEALLDRTCAALARYGTARARRLLIDHGLKSEARLGSPFLRLAEAGRVDLSSSRDLVERIVAAIRTAPPSGGPPGARHQKK